MFHCLVFPSVVVHSYSAEDLQNTSAQVVTWNLSLLYTTDQSMSLRACQDVDRGASQPINLPIFGVVSVACRIECKRSLEATPTTNPSLTVLRLLVEIVSKTIAATTCR